jgi:hypothetical protein
MSFTRVACVLAGALSLSSASRDDAVGYAVVDDYETTLVKQGVKVRMEVHMYEEQSTPPDEGS